LLDVWGRSEIFPVESDNIVLKDYSLERQRALSWEHWRNEEFKKEKKKKNCSEVPRRFKKKRFRQVENMSPVQFVLGLNQEAETFTVSPMSLFMCDSFCLS